jgi:hypothetical protein
MPVPDFSPGEVLTAAAMDSIGLWKVTSGALSGTSTNFVGCFTTDYDNYRIVVDSITSNNTGDVYVRFLANTTPAITQYYWAMRGLSQGATSADNSSGSTSFGFTGWAQVGANNLALGHIFMDVSSPKLSLRTFVNTSASGYQSTIGGFFNRTGMFVIDNTNQYDGIQFLTNSATTFTGNVTIYGYRK